MTREEADFIGSMNMCDEISNEAYKKIMCHCEEQEPCEDSISRKAVLSKFKEVCFSEEWLQFRVDKGSYGQRDFLINYIEQLPSVTPQPKTETLDKLKAEIKEVQTYKMFEGEDTVYVKRNDVLQIIDKYKEGVSNAD